MKWLFEEVIVPVVLGGLLGLAISFCVFMENTDSELAKVRAAIEQYHIPIER